MVNRIPLAGQIEVERRVVARSTVLTEDEKAKYTEELQYCTSFDSLRYIATEIEVIEFQRKPPVKKTGFCEFCSADGQQCIVC